MKTSARIVIVILGLLFVLPPSAAKTALKQVSGVAFVPQPLKPLLPLTRNVGPEGVKGMTRGKGAARGRRFAPNFVSPLKRRPPERLSDRRVRVTLPRKRPELKPRSSV